MNQPDVTSKDRFLSSQRRPEWQVDLQSPQLPVLSASDHRNRRQPTLDITSWPISQGLVTNAVGDEHAFEGSDASVQTVP